MKNVSDLLKHVRRKVLVVVFPHPDDESVMAGGLIQRAKQSGFRVIVICLTKGDQGKIFVNGGGRSIGEIRTVEFDEAMRTLSVNEYYLWSHGDGRLSKSKGWQDKLRALLSSLVPGLIVSYDYSGVSGHPDHIALADYIFKYAKERKIKLLWPSFSGKAKELMTENGAGKILVVPQMRLLMSRREIFRKWRAISAHASQGWARLSMWPLCLGFLLKYPYEEYALADFENSYQVKHFKFAF